MPSSNDCTGVSAACPAEASIYGYYPSLPANAFFVAFFAICMIAQIGLGIKYKTWTLMIAMGLGCFTEIIGYIGRILLHSNPFSSAGFEMQICCLILAPAFNSAAIYLTLKHIVLCFGRQASRIRPVLYTWIFICADLLSLILQGAGGGTAATANTTGQRNSGTGLMIAGICLQVVTLVIFAIMVTDYIYRRRNSSVPLSAEAQATKASMSFRLFAIGLGLAFSFILIRCIYRIAEMVGGWRNSIMQDEPSFIALDNTMVAAATLIQTALHPGIFFPRLSSTFQEVPEEKQANYYSSDNVDA